jgi:precorrin-8X/cobalt-precorrin-8 methylmutase
MFTPADILAESFRIIDRETGNHGFDDLDWPVVRRMIHAAGDLNLLQSVRFHQDPVPAALRALANRAAIVTDVTMVLAGIQEEASKKLGVPLRCFLNDPGIDAKAQQIGSTRCACGFERAFSEITDGIYVVGNAPTALLSLCAAVREDRVRPALIIAVPVGFVAVTESKEEALRLPVPVITVLGRKGGSAIAAAAVNALLLLALERKGP